MSLIPTTYTLKTVGGGWTPLLFTVSLLTTLGTVVPVGYCMGVVNTPAEYIMAWSAATLNESYGWQLDDNQIAILWASIVSAFLVGGIVGSLGSAWVSDKFGRKGALLISEFILFVAGWLFFFCRMASSVEMLLIGRFLAGIAAAFSFTALPMYLMEIAPQELRGSVGTFTAIGICGGICLGQIMSIHQIFGTEENWHKAFSFYIVFVLAGMVPGFWFPESPRWLHVKGNVDAAGIQLKRLRSKKVEERVNTELIDMEASSKSVEKTGFFAVLANKEFCLPMLIVCSFQATQQLSGINAIFYYSVIIYKEAGFSTEQAEWMNLGSGVLNLAVVALGPMLMARFNRRPLMLLSCGGTAICLFSISFVLFYINSASWLPAFCIFLIAAYIITFEIGVGPISYFMGSELFEVAPRPVAMAMGSLCSWCGNFLIGMLFPIVQRSWSSFAFMPCCFVCIYCFLLTLFYLPETRGRDPSELRPIMKDGLKSKVR